MHQFVAIDKWCIEKFGVKTRILVRNPSTYGVWTSTYSTNCSATYSFQNPKDAVLFSLKWANNDTNLHTR